MLNPNTNIYKYQCATNKTYITVNADGASKGNPGKAKIGIIIKDFYGKILIEHSEYLGDNITNNVAEYTAMIMAVELVKNLKESNKVSFDHVMFVTDSKLVVEQIANRWKVKKAHLQKLHTLFNSKWDYCKRELALTYVIQHVKREYNQQADELSNHPDTIYHKEYI